MIGGLGEAQLVADRRFGVDLTRLVDADLTSRVGDKVGDRLERKDLDVAGFFVELGDQLLGGLVVFPGGDQDGVLDGVHHDHRIDALHPAELFYL